MPAMSSAGTASSTDPGHSDHGLKRVIGQWDSIGLVVGLIIGSGIFASPTSVAQHLPNAWLMYAAWILGGLLSLAGGMAAAELGVRYPRSGGQYIFLREAFGPSIAFAFGWSNVLIARPSILAGIATVFAIYFAGLFGLSDGTQKTLAMGAIALFTVVNCLGVKQGTRTQNTFTLVKVVGLVLLASAALFSGRGELAHFGSASAQPLEQALPIAMALAMVTILYTYDGWIDLTYVGGEVSHPERVLPRGTIYGTLVVIAVYLLANTAYILLLSPAEMAANDDVGAIAMQRAFGQTGTVLLSSVVIVSTLGILNGAVLTGVRVPFAMARDGVLFGGLGKISDRTGSPINALVAQGIFAMIVVIFSDSFEQIASLFVSVTWTFYAIAFAGLLVLQWRERKTGVKSAFGDGKFRMPLSPWPAVLFIVVTLFIIGSDLVYGGPQVLVGLGLVALGIPVYWLWNRMRSPRP